MKFINESQQTVTVEAFGVFQLKPGGICEIPDGYAWPTRATNGARKPSILEGLAPQLKPADPAEREMWLRVPTKQQMRERADLEKLPTIEQLIRKGYSLGVAELEVKKQLAAREAAKKQATK